MTFACLYLGRADECPECGGFNDTGHRYCSHECAASAAERALRLLVEAQARRDADDAFAAAAGRLRAAGYGDREIDRILADMP